MDQDKVEKILSELLPYVLPEPIKDVVYDVRHTKPNEFTLHCVFMVPDEFLENLDFINKAAFMHDVKMKLKSKIKNYTGIKVVFDQDNTRLVSQKFWHK
jgi:hypothetical protein